MLKKFHDLLDHHRPGMRVSPQDYLDLAGHLYTAFISKYGADVEADLAFGMAELFFIEADERFKHAAAVYKQAKEAKKL